MQKVMRLFLVIWGLATLISCGTGLTPEKRIEKMHDLVVAKKFDQAIEQLNVLMVDRPTDSQVLFLGGMAYLGMEKYDSAASYAKRFTSLYPKDMDGYRLLYESSEKIGNFQAQLWAVSQMSYMDTDRRKYFPEIARLNFQLGNYGMALATCRDILKNDPGNREVMFTMANSFAAVGNLDSAIVLLEQINKLTPDQVEILTNLALFRAHKGDYTESETMFRRVTQLFPDYVPGWFGLGNVLLIRKDTADAVAAYRQARNRDSTYLGVDSVLRSLNPLGLR
jgi:tetratricopeptide (TPR) repeat protein